MEAYLWGTNLSEALNLEEIRYEREGNLVKAAEVKHGLVPETEPKLAEKTKELGGTVMHGPQDIPGVGRFCVIQDPTGAAISLLTFAAKK